MPTYLMLSRLTAKGVQTLNANPERLKEVNKDVEELGAKVIHQWACLGPFDFVNIVEAPDATTVARVSVRLGRAEARSSRRTSSSRSTTTSPALERKPLPRRVDPVGPLRLRVAAPAGRVAGDLGEAGAR